MKKKWLVAVFVSERDKILKTWSGKVSYDVTDVSVPENTVFYFFSTCEEVNLEVTQLKLSDIEAIAWLGTIKELVHEGKLYCTGQRKGNSISVTNENGKFLLGNVMEVAKQNNLEVEFV